MRATNDKGNVQSRDFSEGDCFVGLCLELDVSSFGDTPEDARSSLQEAVEAFLEECEYPGTLDDVLAESGFDKFGHTFEVVRTGGMLWKDC